MKPQSILSVMALLSVCAISQAQVPTPPNMQDYEAMAKAMEKAQADANQPGDPSLSCVQLQEQLVAVAQDPAFLAHVQAAGVAAEKDLAQMQVPKGEIAAKTAATMVASMVPGAAMGQMMASQAENQVKMAQGAARVQQRMLAGQQMMAFMPKLMRGQRLIELAMVRRCEWATGLGMGSP